MPMKLLPFKEDNICSPPPSFNPISFSFLPMAFSGLPHGFLHHPLASRATPQVTDADP